MNARESTAAEPAPTQAPRVFFLVGARGSGKTTVGRLIAAKLELPFFDCDAVFEANSGRSIREAFAADGESWFRDQEESILAHLAECGPSVIATGGGAVIRESNRNRMRGGGKVIWLRADAGTLFQRLQDDPTTLGRRPNLAGGGRAEIDEVLRVREPLYRSCAHFEVSTAGRSPDAVACDIVAKCKISS